uniref:hypothetical protein n=1 Tax=Bacillaceae bacterium JMAK1 TaxID=1028381 RepID=UPI00155DB98D|nr:hypothetical protein [Bacillaceae bacterium JMAK1]
MSQLQRMNRTCLHEIDELKKHIEAIKEYQMKLYDQAQNVSRTQYKKYVRLVRADDGRHIFYFVYVEDRPILEGHLSTYKFDQQGRPILMHRSDAKRYEGKEWREALKHAKELAEHHCCEIERYGFPKK